MKLFDILKKRKSYLVGLCCFIAGILAVQIGWSFELTKLYSRGTGVSLIQVNHFERLVECIGGPNESEAIQCLGLMAEGKNYFVQSLNEVNRDTESIKTLIEVIEGLKLPTVQFDYKRQTYLKKSDNEMLTISNVRDIEKQIKNLQVQKQLLKAEEVLISREINSRPGAGFSVSYLVHSAMLLSHVTAYF